MIRNNYIKLTSEHLPSLFNTAWTTTCSTEKAVNGFKAAGIYPCNRNIFSDDEYYVEDENAAPIEQSVIAADQQGEGASLADRTNYLLDNVFVLSEEGEIILRWK